jgi:hypothetical protein
MILQHLGTILLFSLIVALFACSEYNPPPPAAPKPEKPVEITLVKQYMRQFHFSSGTPFYAWTAEVNINNKSNFNIIIDTYSGSKVLDNWVTLYNRYGKTVKLMRWHAIGVNEFDTLAPHTSKIYLSSMPMLENLMPPDATYVNFRVLFVTNYDQQRLPELKRTAVGDTLEPKACYGLDFNYIIDRYGSRIRPIEENVDSIFKDCKVEEVLGFF